MRSRRMILITLVLFFTMAVGSGTAAPDFEPEITMTTIAVVMTVVALLLAFFFLMGGVKYVTPENVLDTEIRKNLYEYIDEYPGSHLREIARELDLKPSNAAWHLRKLEQTNLIRSRAIGGKKVYYLVAGWRQNNVPLQNPFCAIRTPGISWPISRIILGSICLR